MPISGHAKAYKQAALAAKFDELFNLIDDADDE